MLQAAKEKTRSAVRELFVCGFIAVPLVVWLNGFHHYDGASVFATLFVSFISAPFIWAAYRVVRFAVGR